MADNYLEKKYEEYRSGKASLGKKKITTPHKTRRVFVTDGINGIGNAIVKAFRRAGHRVAFCGNDEEAGKLMAEKTGTYFFHADRNDKEALGNCIKGLLANWGDLDIIIHNAEIGKSAPITETGVEDFETTLFANLRSVYIVSQQLALHRQSQNEANTYGRILNILPACPSSEESGNEGCAASGGGLLSLTRALAKSLARWNITVNSVTPGENAAYEEDIIRMCLYLCQEENRSINGENITIGGSLLKGIY